MGDEGAGSDPARRGGALESHLAERFAIERWLDEERPAVQRALERAMAAPVAGLRGPLSAAMRHGVMGGGKRVRPLLLVASWRAAREGKRARSGPGASLPGTPARPRRREDPSEGEGGVDGGDALYDLAAAVELIHAYSLMHDDLPCMDDAALRRGQPTTHRAHGEALTIVAGAALVPLAVLWAWRACARLGLSGQAARDVVATLVRAAGAGGMVGGQALDLLAEARSLGAEELDALHRCKTGALLAAPPRMGALAAGADQATVRALEAYGRALGLAFQIADDVLDVTASPTELGKNPSDAALAKSTYVTLHGLAEARRRAREEGRRAVEALDAAGLAAPPLRALADYAVSRRH